MIYFADEKRLNALKDFCIIQSVYSCRISCLAESYGMKINDIQFWLQYDEDGSIASAISKYGGDVTVQLTQDSDIAEITEFIKAIGFGSVISGAVLFDELPYEENIIMELSDFKGRTLSGTEVEVNPRLDEVYELMRSCGSDTLTVPQYEDFLLDMSHKIRHNTALCIGIRSGASLVGTAMTVAQSGTTAVIGGVAVKKCRRRTGCGSAAVTELVNMLGRRKIFIVRGKNENEEFYKSLGFKNTGTAVSCTGIIRGKEEMP